MWRRVFGNLGICIPVVFSVMVSGILHHVYGKDGNEKEDVEKVCGP